MSRRSLESLYLATQPLVLNLLALPVMAFVVRSQGDENFGQWQTAMTITGTVGVLSHLGLRPYFVRAIAQEPDSAGERLAEQLGLRLALATLGAVLAIGASLLLGHSRIVVLCTVIASLGNLINAAAVCFADVLEGLERFLAYTNVAFLSGISLQVASILVGMAGWGPIALSLAYLMAPTVSLAFQAIVVHRTGGIRLHLQPRRWMALLRTCRAQSRANLLGAIEDRGEPLILPKVTDYANMGHFAAGNIPASRLVSIPYGLSSYYFPKLARRHAAGQDLSETVTHLLTLLLLLTLPITLGVCHLSGWVSGLLFPTAPDLCAEVMRWTAWSLPLAALGSGFMCSLQAAGRIDQTARIELLTIVIGLLVTIVCVFQGGVFGAALSWLARAAIGTALLLPAFWRLFFPGFAGVPWGRLAAACLLMQGTFSGARWLPLSPTTILWGSAVAGSLVFLGFLALTGVLRPTRVGAMLSGGTDI
ncbi:MAG TPA: oligosaccharide flippase family protein [Polyangia bacterium]